jgi:hypothetical protein
MQSAQDMILFSFIPGCRLILTTVLLDILLEKQNTSFESILVWYLCLFFNLLKIKGKDVRILPWRP